MSGPVHIQQNHLLASLPEESLERITPHLERVTFQVGQVLCESGAQLGHVVFPTSSILSLHYVLENGASSEIAGVGKEGMLGISLLMGGITTPSRALVQTAGEGIRIKGRLFVEEFQRGGPLTRLMLRYTQALMTQISQTAVCNRHHALEQQLCRWLLLTLDRLDSNELIMTQELVAGMLGVRRESVTEAAGRLQAAGLIRYRRGHISVLERAGLEAQACECYGVVRKEFARLLQPGRAR